MAHSEFHPELQSHAAENTGKVPAVCFALKFLYYSAAFEVHVYHFIERASLVSRRWIQTIDLKWPLIWPCHFMCRDMAWISILNFQKQTKKIFITFFSSKSISFLCIIELVSRKHTPSEAQSLGYFSVNVLRIANPNPWCYPELYQYTC